MQVRRRATGAAALLSTALLPMPMSALAQRHRHRHRHAVDASSALIARSQAGSRRRPPVPAFTARLPRAGDPGATIADFRFTPSTITIHVGDTVTWTNNGPSAHTATASDGSFDTGTLSPGQSASHTFGQTGAFAYICKIHPFMHGTVVVLASGGSAGGSTSQGSTTGSGAPGAGSGAGSASASPSTSASVSSQSRQTLPVTGEDSGLALVSGALLVLGGVFVRRRWGRESTSA